jgi:hypothetical protein
MSDNVHIDGSTRIGIIGGTILVTILNIFHNDFIRTIGFAALGATVSFFVSLFWKWMVRQIDKSRMKKLMQRDGNSEK